MITDTPFDEVQLHTNQNGDTIKIDELYLSSDAELPPSDVPEPTTLAIWGTLGSLGLIAARRGRRRVL